jgi:hypothetical protein
MSYRKAAEYFVKVSDKKVVYRDRKFVDCRLLVGPLSLKEWAFLQQHRKKIIRFVDQLFFLAIFHLVLP